MKRDTRFKKGSVPWNKGLKGFKHSGSFKTGHKAYENSGQFQKGNNLNEQHPLWKGAEASYSAIHYWISRKLGKPRYCENCKDLKAKRYEWANRSGQYIRDYEDWVRLCVPCHRAFDGRSTRRVVSI